MTALRPLTGPELRGALEYLSTSAGVQLRRHLSIQESLGGSHAKVVEELRAQARLAREVAQALELLDIEKSE